MPTKYWVCDYCGSSHKDNRSLRELVERHEELKAETQRKIEEFRKIMNEFNFIADGGIEEELVKPFNELFPGGE